MKQRKIPLRKCTGCNEMKNKKELVRVVRSDEGEVSLDFTGKKPGRGAYVCQSVQCLEKAKKTKGFERSFKAPVPESVYENLKQEILSRMTE